MKAKFIRKYYGTGFDRNMVYMDYEYRGQVSTGLDGITIPLKLYRQTEVKETQTDGRPLKHTERRKNNEN